jgi:hypothetical protein
MICKVLEEKSGIGAIMNREEKTHNLIAEMQEQTKADLCF